MELGPPTGPPGGAEFAALATPELIPIDAATTATANTTRSIPRIVYPFKLDNLWLMTVPKKSAGCPILSGRPHPMWCSDPHA